MKKYTITSGEYYLMYEKLHSLENENNKLKGYIEGLEKQLTIPVVVFNEAKTIDKQTQKKLIEQIMKSDEELGLYSEAELCECGGNKRVGLDCTRKPCKHPYYKK